MPILGILASSRPAFELVGSYDSLATVTLSATTASVTFAGIPSGYKHLQIRCLTRGASGSGGTPVYLTVNGDTAANYSTHQLFGSGATANAGGHASASYILDGWAGFQSFAGGDTANCFGVGIIDILDYADTSKNKTARALWGRDNNATSGTTGRVMLESGSWRNTAAITSLTFTTDAGYGVNWAANSTFALYGVK